MQLRRGLGRRVQRLYPYTRAAKLDRATLIKSLHLPFKTPTKTDHTDSLKRPAHQLSAFSSITFQKVLVIPVTAHLRFIYDIHNFIITIIHLPLESHCHTFLIISLLDLIKSNS